MPPRIRSWNPRTREGVFISYAHSDGDNIAADLRRQLTSEGFLLWQDLVAMEGGRDWWLQITEALDHVEFMALVITPNALKSDTIRKEWRYARQEGVCVYPIKGTPEMDFDAVPRWLRNKHFYDISNQLQWEKFLNDLKTRCQVPRVPFMVEDLPEDFVDRPEEFDQLLAYLRDSKDGGPIAITAALRGAGGYGKTTLAKALCHNEDVQDAFEDGILWVTLGENPGDLGGRVADLVETLSGERPGFSDVNTAAVRLRELLTDRDVLLVIDDVWDSTHLTPFMQGTGRGARLITTRNIDTLPPNTKRVDVDAMQRDEAVALLAADVPDIDKLGLRRLAERLGEWPLLLGIVSGVLRHRVINLGQDPGAALNWVNEALDRRGLTAFDARNPQAREQAVKQTLSVSIDLLDQKERERYVELAVFPEDVEIPLATLAKLWGKTGGLDEFDTETLCERLDRVSLIERFDPNRRVIGLHDVFRQYLIGEHRDRLPAFHDALLDAHRPPVNQVSYSALSDWAELPGDELYLWDYLAYHLIAAGRGDELILTAKNLRYLAAKTVARNALAVEGDLLAAEQFAMSDDVQRLLRRRFIQSSHVLDSCKDRREAEVTLYSRLVHEDELTLLTEALAETLHRPFIAPVHPLPDLPDPALLRTLSGHASQVRGCAISDDGDLIVSTSWDQTVKVWDSASGALLRTLSGHNGPVHRCAISRDDKLIISASEDRTVKVWDALSGALLRTLTGHNDAVYDCAISGDGTVIVSASDDQTLKVWDGTCGRLLRTLSGHDSGVSGCAISEDGSLIVSSSYDRTLRVWDGATGALLFTLSGHTGGVRACAISEDGALIVSASNDGTVKIWDSASGALLRTLFGHTHIVFNCAISEDSALIISSSGDQTVRVWDSASGTLLRTLSGHTAMVEGCAIRRDGTLIVSASDDQTVKVWDGRSGGPLQTLSGPASGVSDCAISEDGLLVVSASGEVKMWDGRSGTQLRMLSEGDGWVHGCAISGDGALVVSTFSDRKVKVWDSGNGALLWTLSGHTRGLSSGCAINGAGTVIVSASDHKTLNVWDAASGALLHTLYGHTNSVRDCAISRDGALIVSASDDYTVKVWDAASGSLLHTLSGHHGEFGLRCAISGDGTLVVSASNDQTLKVWDAASGVLLRTLWGHTSGVNGCAISGDGSLIVSISWDQTVRVWDVRNGECMVALHVDGTLYGCAIDAVGNCIMAGGSRGLYFLRLVR